ncbi:MAG: hypothetical protein EAZ08_08725 [Cytophagales bacterium]|nr:MAG: hypothetical protein EAZ08_08725 [Cytophagales bacterium]
MKIRWINWEELADGQLKSFAKLFSLNSSKKAIANVFTKFKLLKVADDLFFPVTINDFEMENSFVCSPHTAYVRYSKEELLRKIDKRWIQLPLLLLIRLIDKWLKYGQIDKNIHVNNFLLSTNPYPEWDGSQIKAITEFIKSEYPEHTIIFRSLNVYQHQHLLENFETLGYQKIGSRQVYIFDSTEEEWLKRRNNKLDNKMIKAQQLIYLKHEEMKDYLDQALLLYNKLYLEKYSKHNPQFTNQYFHTCYDENIIHFQGFKDNSGVLKAFSGLFIIEDTITSPLLGYDTAAPQEDGLYIHAARLAVIHKFNTKKLLNLSSGASKFKRFRGGIPAIEYSVVYAKHLSFKRRFTWSVLQFISNKIGVPLLDKYEL